MREGDISTKRFRELATEVGSLLTYEATADFETEKWPLMVGTVLCKLTKLKVKKWR